MDYVSTRGSSPPISFSAALERGLAPDGGLYVPRELPRFTPAAHGGIVPLAARLLAPFLEGDSLASRVGEICAETFTFPLPLVGGPAGDGTSPVAFLELFHGPTAAFKDVGARFLARCLTTTVAGPRTVLVATSGDTGGAVAAAFHDHPGIEVAILFPRDGVSPTQQRQLTCWGGNVRAFAVRGTFDDCQAMLKAALGSEGLGEERNLTTANSINIARLLAQTVYYAWASFEYFDRHGRAPSFVVPTGNVGNSTAALWAKHMGFPIDRVVLATNANRTIPDYLSGGEWTPRPAVPTLANAMDVGNPSNMERIDHLYPTLADLRRDVDAIAVDDHRIREVIARGAAPGSRILDPHTATAVHAVESLDVQDAIVVATAHPAKFASIVEPLLGRPLEVPPSLAWIEEQPEHFQEIEPGLDSLRRAMG